MDETLELLAVLTPTLDELMAPYLHALQVQHRAAIGAGPLTIPDLLRWAEARAGDSDARTRVYWHAWHALILARSEMEFLR